MSTGAKRKHAEALADAEAFKSLFPASCYERWTIAGSVRRLKPEVGDVEHVVIAREGDLPGKDLFATPVKGSLLWHRVDELREELVVSQHIYIDKNGHGAFRWGERYRGLDFRGFNHEIFLAYPDGWGSRLAICTGPADYSHNLVSVIQRFGRYCKDGRVWQKNNDGRPDDLVPVPEEADFFKACGVPYIEPEKRK